MDWRNPPVGWAIIVTGIIVGGLLSAAVYFSSEDRSITVVTGILAVLTFFYVRTMHRIEWLTGAMERHSDQIRQIAAKEAKVEMIWWDKTRPEAGGRFPPEGNHGEVHDLKRIYIGTSPRDRTDYTAWVKLRRFVWGK